MNRRELILGALAAGVALPSLESAWAQAVPPAAPSPMPLAVTRRTLEVNGKAASVFGLARPDGTPGLTLNAGEAFRVALSNAADAPTLVHWHGLTPPWAQDGVPDMPAPLLAPGETRQYDFPAGPGGTHWMHAHTLQEQALLAAPLIVRTAQDQAADEQEVVVLLHDFSFTPAEELLARLRGGGQGAVSPGAMNHGAMGQASMDLASKNHGSMGGMSMPMSSMPMAGMSHGAMGHGAGGGMDLNDIAFDAYLANDRTLDDPQVVRVERGGRVRLRLINGATATAFTLDSAGLEGELIAVDGQPVAPVRGRRFPIAMGQRLDVRFALPQAGGAFPLLALREGAPERTGVILATPGAAVARLPAAGEAAGPVIDLALEQALRPLAPLPARTADQRFQVALSGNMAGYDWSIGDGAPLAVRRGQRVEIAMRNASMMMHPMHLHGHHFQVVEINGRRLSGAVRDTVAMPPMSAVTIAFDTDNPGRWAFHCHHLYHMAAGMMSFVAYEGVG
ncbi:multicopper oxidase family protein [Azorhizobium doebereinerae]|uniref:multicopper oxidase family protein n=1 Tax=Azorhizobium doebereinerae TaxID=281091 RepID=UPI0004002196|nr:multicopper oxidase family protein [Azorhizobium doebereinerae]